MHVYTEEFQCLASRNNLGETEEQLIACFASGLKIGVQEKMQLHTTLNLSERINMAEHVERFNSRNWKGTNQQAMVRKEGSSNSVPHGNANAEKGPLLDTLKDAKGHNIDPS